MGEEMDIDQTYIKRCGFCSNDAIFILRASNVNTMSDKDIIFIAAQQIGQKEGGWCENCRRYTEHTRVAYNLEGYSQEEED